MKKDRLESFVNENRQEFDRMSPSDKLWESISSQMSEVPVKRVRRFTFLKVAALLAVVALSSALVYRGLLTDNHDSAQVQQIDPEVLELIEAEAFYAQEVSGKMIKIENCYKVNPELKSQIEGDLNELESMYLSLKNDLKDNISNKEVIEAMIENNRNRMKLVDEVLEQIKC